MRLSIEITPEQHQCLKAAAALQGKSIKNYVLERAFSSTPSVNGMELAELEKLLQARIESAARGMISTKSVADIADEILAR